MQYMHCRKGGWKVHRCGRIVSVHESVWPQPHMVRGSRPYARKIRGAEGATSFVGACVLVLASREAGRVPIDVTSTCYSSRRGKVTGASWTDSKVNLRAQASPSLRRDGRAHCFREQVSATNVASKASCNPSKLRPPRSQSRQHVVRTGHDRNPQPPTASCGKKMEGRRPRQSIALSLLAITEYRPRHSASLSNEARGASFPSTA